MIKIVSESFDPWSEIPAYQALAHLKSGCFGATCAFIGTMRDFNDEKDIDAMVLEYYPGMTEMQLEKVVEEAGQNWKIIDTLVVHRVGRILPGDPIVLVTIWASHRGDAFDAARFIMEVLKSKAPFWKKEILTAGNERWVEKNSNGYL